MTGKVGGAVGIGSSTLSEGGAFYAKLDAATGAPQWGVGSSGGMNAQGTGIAASSNKIVVVGEYGGAPTMSGHNFSECGSLFMGEVDATSGALSSPSYVGRDNIGGHVNVALGGSDTFFAGQLSGSIVFDQSTLNAPGASDTDSFLVKYATINEL